MTDERLDPSLWETVARLPRGSGIVFRHHATPLVQREALFARLAIVARRRRLILLRDGDRRIARVHSFREAGRVRRNGAEIAFVSPVFATRTHLSVQPLGLVRAAAILRATGLPGVALGGMTRQRFKELKRLGFQGWAAIDGLAIPRQKRNAVPI